MEFLSFEVTCWTILLLLVLSLLYWYFWAGDNYWKNKGIPYVPNETLTRSLFTFLLSGKGLHELQDERYKKYGRLFGTQQRKQRGLSLADPDLIRNVFVKDFKFFTGRQVILSGDPVFDNLVTSLKGEKWKRVRTIMTPAFSTGKIKKMTDIILNSAKVLVQNLSENAGKPVDSKKFFETFTMDVIASAAFATKIQSYQNPNNKFVQAARNIFARISIRGIIFVLFPWIFKVLRINPFDTQAINFFKETTLEIIEERRRTGKKGNDFLQLLMDAEKENQEEELEKMTHDEITVDESNINSLGHNEGNQVFATKKRYKSLSHDELIAQCIIFFLGGFESIASTLVFASHMLALHPNIQEKLHEEINSVIRSHKGQLTYEGIQDMKYLDQFLTETLRMFPFAIFLLRVADEAYELGNTGIVIEKDVNVVAPVYSMHHDPEFYAEPEKFKPERFTAEEKAKLHPYAYLPFGAGPRNCIGMRFALMEIKICLAHMISQLKILPGAEKKMPLEVNSRTGGLKPKDATLYVEKR